MTDMSTASLKVFGPRFMLAMLLATFASFAQDADEFEPAVDTSASLEPAVNTSNTADETTDDIEPAVSSAALAADVTRDESGNQVMDRMELGRTEITGNQELPKVLYIVPWQKSSR